MNNVSIKTIVVIAIVVIFGLAVITTVGSYFSYNNKEVGLREQAEAQRGKVEGVHDAMWKIISQKAQVSQDYRASFDSIYTHIIAGRYSQGDGALMKWITESNPNFDTSLYKDVMDAIESERTNFRHAQERMIDIKRQHSTLCKTYPGKWFISNTSEIEYTVISSSYSKEVMQSGTDDNVTLYK
jgi:hypothetical protein